MARILIIDDETNIRKTLREIMEDEGHDVAEATDGEAGVRAAREECPDVILLDIMMPRRDGLTLLKEIKEQSCPAEVIMISGHGTIESAVTAIKAGAYHFLQKPLSMIEVKQIVRHAVDAKTQRDELRQLRGRDDDRYRMIGSGPAVARLQADIARVAPTAARVLILGESGSGKELVAYAIHKQSDRSGTPFVKVNCAAIPSTLIESELFGYEKGAFTGAAAQKKGKFELAHKGTLLLDEIGDMDLNTQTKVLRAIQEGEIERVGGTKTVRVDVRVIAATHRNLESMIAGQAFREDLYYRLAVIVLRVPRLAERADDIPRLAEHFLDGYCRDCGAPPRTLSADALSFLMQQAYPGNIRQLRNIVERAAIMCPESVITAAFLHSLLQPGGPRQAAQSPASWDLLTSPRPLEQAKEELERLFVQAQLQLNEWDIPKTAEVLGIQRTNLHRKIRQLGIRREQ